MLTILWNKYRVINWIFRSKSLIVRIYQEEKRALGRMSVVDETGKTVAYLMDALPGRYKFFRIPLTGSEIRLRLLDGEACLLSEYDIPQDMVIVNSTTDAARQNKEQDVNSNRDDGNDERSAEE